VKAHACSNKQEAASGQLLAPLCPVNRCTGRHSLVPHAFAGRAPDAGQWNAYSALSSRQTPGNVLLPKLHWCGNSQNPGNGRFSTPSLAKAARFVRSRVQNCYLCLRNKVSPMSQEGQRAGQPGVLDEVAKCRDLGLVHTAGSIFWFSRNVNWCRTLTLGCLRPRY